jgi:hypothetical protein
MVSLYWVKLRDVLSATRNRSEKLSIDGKQVPYFDYFLSMMRASSRLLSSFIEEPLEKKLESLKLDTNDSIRDE